MCRLPPGTHITDTLLPYTTLWRAGGEHAGEDAGGDQGRGEARALLVGPHRDLDGRRRLDAVVVQGADDLEAGQHTEHAVELAAGRLGVEVTAGGDRRQ